MNRPVRCLAGLALLLLIGIPAARPAAAQVELQARPLLATDDALDQWTGGVRYSLLARHEVDTPATDFFAQLQSTGQVLLDAALNTEPLVFDLSAGGVLNLFKPPTVGTPPGVIPDPDAPPADPGYDYGRLDFGLSAHYEVEQTFEDQNAALALVLGYVHTRRDGLWLVVPSFVLALDGVLPVRDNTRGDLGVGDDAFLRFRIDASLDVPFGQFLNPMALRPFGLHGRYAFSHEFGAHRIWEAAGFDQAHYVSGALSYNLSRGFLDEIYVQATHGRIPPEVQKLTLFKIGVLLARR